MDAKKYRVVGSVSGVDYTWKPKQILSVGETNTDSTITASAAQAYLAAQEIVEHVDAKAKTQRAVASRDGIETADARP